MYSFSSDSKFLIITDGIEAWKLEKNQVSLKTANELVIIDRNGMHYKNFPYTQVVGGYVNATAVVAYLETLVNTGQPISGSVSVSNFPATQNVSVTNTPTVNTGLTQPLTDTQLRATPVLVSGTLTIDTTGLATSDNQTSGAQKTQVTSMPTYMVDAAGRLRVSQVNNLGDYKILNSYFDTTILEQVGTSTFTTSVNTTAISVTSGQYGIVKSKLYHPYFNGKSQIIQFTFKNMGSASNVEKSVGYISSDATSTYNTGLDGFRIFKDTSNNYFFQVWRNGVLFQNISRSSWSDKLDGTGQSGMNINWDYFNVITADFLYLGGTDVSVYINYNGLNWEFIRYNHAGTDASPIFNSPNKPIRYEIRSTTGTGTLNFICATVGSEGQTNGMGYNAAVKGAYTGLVMSTTGTKYGVVAVRKSATYRDIYAVVESFEGIVKTNDFIDWDIVLNPTIAGVAPNWNALSGTPLEYAQLVNTNTITGGISLGNTYSSLNMNNARVVENILARLNSTIANVMDVIVLCGTPSLASTNITGTGSMQVRFIV
jgi:hypothetical protein